MYQFTPRLSAPYKTNPVEVPLWFANPRNAYYPTYQMPNCTCYSWGRVMELGNLNNLTITSDGFLGNGGLWGDNGYIGQTWKKGTTPKLGAVAVWTESGQAGHCAVVEQINDDGSYVCSNSGWYRPIDTTNWHYFFITNCTSDNVIYYNGVRWGSYTFKTFLYPPYIDEEPEPPEPPEPPIPIPKKKSWIPLAMASVMKGFTN